MGEHTAAVEAWLGTAGFEEAKDVAYVMARGGSGSFDRNISPLVLEAVVAALHTQLPAGLVLPAPDRDFIRAGTRPPSFQNYRVISHNLTLLAVVLLVRQRLRRSCRQISISRASPTRMISRSPSRWCSSSWRRRRIC